MRACAHSMHSHTDMLACTNANTHTHTAFMQTRKVVAHTDASAQVWGPVRKRRTPYTPASSSSHPRPAPRAHAPCLRCAACEHAGRPPLVLVPALGTSRPASAVQPHRGALRPRNPRGLHSSHPAPRHNPPCPLCPCPLPLRRPHPGRHALQAPPQFLHQAQKPGRRGWCRSLCQYPSCCRCHRRPSGPGALVRALRLLLLVLEGWSRQEGGEAGRGLRRSPGQTAARAASGSSWGPPPRSRSTQLCGRAAPPPARAGHLRRQRECTRRQGWSELQRHACLVKRRGGCRARAAGARGCPAQQTGAAEVGARHTVCSACCTHAHTRTHISKHTSALLARPVASMHTHTHTFKNTHPLCPLGLLCADAQFTTVPAPHELARTCLGSRGHEQPHHIQPPHRYLRTCTRVRKGVGRWQFGMHARARCAHRRVSVYARGHGSTQAHAAHAQPRALGRERQVNDHGTLHCSLSQTSLVCSASQRT